MSNAELEALIEATYKVEQIAPGLLAWLDSACVWQLQRRNGYQYELQPPEAAIPPEEDAVSINAAIALRDGFAKESPAVRALFDALIALLTGEGGVTSPPVWPSSARSGRKVKSLSAAVRRRY